jgi:hypothetical protein
MQASSSQTSLKRLALLEYRVAQTEVLEVTAEVRFYLIA